MFNTYIYMDYLDEKTDETIQTDEASGNATDSAQKNSDQSVENQTGDTDVSKQTGDLIDPNVSNKTDDLDDSNASNHPDDLDDRIISNETDDLDDTVSYLNLS